MQYAFITPSSRRGKIHPVASDRDAYSYPGYSYGLNRRPVTQRNGRCYYRTYTGRRRSKRTYSDGNYGYSRGWPSSATFVRAPSTGDKTVQTPLFMSSIRISLDIFCFTNHRRAFSAPGFSTDNLLIFYAFSQPGLKVHPAPTSRLTRYRTSTLSVLSEQVVGSLKAP